MISYSVRKHTVYIIHMDRKFIIIMVIIKNDFITRYNYFNNGVFMVNKIQFNKV